MRSCEVARKVVYAHARTSIDAKCHETSSPDESKKKLRAETTINASAREFMSMKVTATLSTRSHFSWHHLFAACRLSARIGEVERENEGREFGSFWEEILQSALGVATLSVACLECYANELYFEGAAIAEKLNPTATALVGDLIDNASILRKYEAALAIRRGKSLDYGCVAVQNADALIKLRNAVIHFRPEWSNAQVNHDRLSKILMYKFRPSPFLPETEPLFPLSWASHDFAKWALKSTVVFLEHFYAEAEITSPLHIENKRQLSAMSAGAI